MYIRPWSNRAAPHFLAAVDDTACVCVRSIILIGRIAVRCCNLYSLQNTTTNVSTDVKIYTTIVEYYRNSNG